MKNYALTCKRWWLCCPLLLWLTPPAAYSQNSVYSTRPPKNSDTVICYTLTESRGIAAGLLELKQLRADYPALALAAGYHAGYKRQVDSLLTVYVARRTFLGIGARRARRRLQRDIAQIP